MLTIQDIKYKYLYKMKKNPFYFEIKDILTQFVGAFDDIVINRYNKNRSVKNRIKVRYVYSPKQRVIHDLVNKSRHITLPAVAVNITNIKRDQNRVFNKIAGAYFASAETRVAPVTGQHLTSAKMPQPVPINITVSMSILARYQSDIDQIISNFVPYNDPYIVISWMLPSEFTPYDQEIRTEVQWDGSLNLNYPDELSPGQPYRVACDTSFEVKGWLFKHSDIAVDNIYKITINTSPVSGIESQWQLVGDPPYFEKLTETSGLPPLTAAPYVTHVDTYSAFTDQSSLTVLGYNFEKTDNIYLSGSEINQVSGVGVTPFTDTALNTMYPSFTGVPVKFKMINDNVIKVDLPITSISEEMDLIVQGPGGYNTSINSPNHGKGILLNSGIGYAGLIYG